MRNSLLNLSRNFIAYNSTRGKSVKAVTRIMRVEVVSVSFLINQ
jgi:hypothetical protein